MSAAGEADSTKHIVHGYVFLKTSLRSSSGLEKIEDAFAAALESHLDPVSSPSTLSNRVIYQRLTTTTTSSTKFTPLDVRSFRQSTACAAFEGTHSVEVVLIPGSSDAAASIAPPSIPPRLAVFDMDSTLIDQEVIDELAEQVGRKAEVQAITERAMRGELDFGGSLRQRVAMLRGVRADVWEQLRGRLTIAKGARELCAALKRNGAHLAVFSGGFQPMADWLKGELGLDVAVANHLLISPPTDEFPYAHLTGELEPGHPIVDSAHKRHLLLELANKHSSPLTRVLCVGDGANDLPMLLAVGEAGGVALACRAKPKVQAEAPNRLGLTGDGSLADLVWLFDPESLRNHAPNGL